MASGRYSALVSGFESLCGARRRGDSDTQAVPYFPQTNRRRATVASLPLALSRLPDPGFCSFPLVSPSQSRRGLLPRGPGLRCRRGRPSVELQSEPSQEPFRCAAKSEREGLAGWEEAEPLAPAGPLPWVVALVVSRGGGVGAPGGIGGLGTGRPGGAGVGLAGQRGLPGRVERHGGRAAPVGRPALRRGPAWRPWARQRRACGRPIDLPRGQQIGSGTGRRWRSC
jgi:hypothetical protein